MVVSPVSGRRKPLMPLVQFWHRLDGFVLISVRGHISHITQDSEPEGSTRNTARLHYYSAHLHPQVILVMIRVAMKNLLPVKNLLLKKIMTKKITRLLLPGLLDFLIRPAMKKTNHLLTKKNTRILLEILLHAFEEQHG
jgi:hypothetical protein